MERFKIKQYIDQMTLEEKIKFCIGKDFWHLQGSERLGIPVTMIADGPHGLRKQVEGADHLGLGESNPAICFPTGCALASSFDPELAEKIGHELGKLCQKENVSTLLGPAMNIKRSPLCGRNFEYYSEDPLLSSKIAVGMVKGVQAEGVGTSPKHFLANNQEFFRMTSDSQIDERTMREIYLASFEEMVKEAKPWTMMCSYNKINGIYASENQKYLTDILRGEWGFDGYVMTDWGACNDSVDSMKAGLDLIMPGPGADYSKQLLKAVETGELEESVIDRSVERILNIVLRYSENRKEKAVYDFENGHMVAMMAAEESAVLLKNEEAVLPLSEKETVLVVGKYAKAPRYQGNGSSHIHSYKVSSAWDVLRENKNVCYAAGYDDITEQAGETFLQEALKEAQKVEKVVVFAGLPESYESEGMDRPSLHLQNAQNQLISELAKVNPNIIVVLHNGSPISMPWIDSVKAVLEVYLGGEAIGPATVNLLYGKANPSGRLAETFPIRIEDTPTYPYYGTEYEEVPYREGILVGYRYYETMKRKVLFPFGHGLSYTNFSYSDLKTSKEEMDDTDTLQVFVKVKNIGKRAGKEVVQLYVSSNAKTVVRPERELKAFEKIYLEAGEEKTICFNLNKRAFAYWDVRISDWNVESGCYSIQICHSANEVITETVVKINSTTVIKPQFTINSPMGEIMKYPAAIEIMQKAMANIMEETAGLGADADEASLMTQEAVETASASMPLRALLSFSEKAKKKDLEKLVEEMNRTVQNL